MRGRRLTRSVTGNRHSKFQNQRAGDARGRQLPVERALVPRERPRPVEGDEHVLLATLVRRVAHSEPHVVGLLRLRARLPGKDSHRPQGVDVTRDAGRPPQRDIVRVPDDGPKNGLEEAGGPHADLEFEAVSSVGLPGWVEGRGGGVRRWARRTGRGGHVGEAVNTHIYVIHMKHTYL